MTWADAGSGPDEAALDKAWETLNKAFPDSIITTSTQHRLTACVKDTISFPLVLRELLAVEFARIEASTRRTAPGPAIAIDQ